jgi:hypothetical protein
MKKLKVLCIAFFGVLSFQGANAQAVSQGNVIVDAYYGWGSVFGNLLQQSAGAVNVSYRNIGTAGVRFEYMVGNRFGIGLESNFKSTSLSQTRSSWDGMTNYEDKISWNRFRVMPRFNFHFLDADKVDVYSAIAVGYANHNVSAQSTEPDYAGFQMNIPFNIGTRIATGMRYFFTDNLGANIEFGLGGGDLIHFGLSARF